MPAMKTFVSLSLLLTCSANRLSTDAVQSALTNADVNDHRAQINEVFQNADANGNVRVAPTMNIVETAAANRDLTIFTKLCKAAYGFDSFVDNLVDPTSKQRVTVFAPSNNAFNVLPAGVLDKLLKSSTVELQQFLYYHVIQHSILYEDLVAMVDGTEIKTVRPAKPFNVVVHNKFGVKINDATITNRDNMATTGVIHIIDALLISEADIQK